MSLISVVARNMTIECILMANPGVAASGYESNLCVVLCSHTNTYAIGIEQVPNDCSRGVSIIFPLNRNILCCMFT